MQGSFIDAERFETRTIISHLVHAEILWISYKEIFDSEALYEYKQPEIYIAPPMGQNRRCVNGKHNSEFRSKDRINEPDDTTQRSTRRPSKRMD